MHILSASFNIGSCCCILNGLQRGKRSTDNHFHIRVFYQRSQFLYCYRSFFRCFMHFPVSCYNWSSHPQSPLTYIYFSSNAATPGSTLPSRNSREAPPPVEIWVILSASPKCSTAAAESPPPMIVVPWEAARALAISFVPLANCGSSKTPIGPFQMTVRACLISAVYSFTASGPISSP